MTTPRQLDPMLDREAAGDDSSRRADLHDAARRWRAGDAAAAAAPGADLANVVLFDRFRRNGNSRRAPVIVADHPARVPDAEPEPRSRRMLFMMLSLAAHAALYMPLQRDPVPMASVGLETIAVDLVPGADENAGPSSDGGSSAAVSAPEPAQAPDAQPAPETPVERVATAAPQESEPAAPEPDAEAARAEDAPPSPAAEAQPDAAPVAPAKPDPETPPEAAVSGMAEAAPAELSQDTAQQAVSPAPRETAQETAAEDALQPRAAPAATEPVAIPLAIPLPEPRPAEPTPPLASSGGGQAPKAVEPGRTERRKAGKTKVGETKVRKTEPGRSKARRRTREAREAAPGERNRSTTRQPAARAAGGIGRGRSDADTNYRGMVAAHLARYKRFPTDARGRGEGGRTVVSFSLNGSGSVTSARLVNGSGIASLDQESLAMVRRASPFPAPPSGRAMHFTVPVSFQLR